jgi:hypothetical protein
MKLSLHEVETGVSNLAEGRAFYSQLLGDTLAVDQPALAVWNAGLPGLDFNLSTHLPAGVVCISFLTSSLDEVIEKLQLMGVDYTPARPSHLGMLSISFRDPAGLLIKVNMPTEASPEWLKQTPEK